jgi:hypothetical protein
MIEFLNGTNVASAATMTTPVGWSVEASADFNHDNKADIILQANDGLPQIWLMNGTGVTSTVTLPNSGPSWHVIATGDFNGDGKADIIWQNDDGTPDFWLMNGTTLISGVPLPNPGSTWHVKHDGPIAPDQMTAGALPLSTLKLSSPDAAAVALLPAEILPGLASDPSSRHSLFTGN